MIKMDEEIRNELDVLGRPVSLIDAFKKSAGAGKPKRKAAGKARK